MWERHYLCLLNQLNPHLQSWLIAVRWDQPNSEIWNELMLMRSLFCIFRRALNWITRVRKLLTELESAGRISPWWYQHILVRRWARRPADSTQLSKPMNEWETLHHHGKCCSHSSCLILLRGANAFRVSLYIIGWNAVMLYMCCN